MKVATKRIVSYSLGAIGVLIGATLFVNDPAVRLLWVFGGMFITFYAISAMTDGAVATAIGYLIMIAVLLWDQHISGELRLEAIRWAVYVLSIGNAIAVVVELLLRR